MTEDVGLLDWISPGHIDFYRTRESLGQRSIECRKIAEGGANPDLYKIFERSIMGNRLPDKTHASNPQYLSEYEKSLLVGNAKVLVVMDFDGVMVSPVHVQKAGFERIFLFTRLVKAADKLVLWTNRLMPDKGKLAQSGTFPFLGANLAKRIEDLGRDQTGSTNVEVRGGKSRGGAKELGNIIHADDYDMIYIIGSSGFDRKIVTKLAYTTPDPRKVVYMDTCHFLF